MEEREAHWDREEEEESRSSDWVVKGEVKGKGEDGRRGREERRTEGRTISEEGN